MDNLQELENIKKPLTVVVSNLQDKIQEALNLAGNTYTIEDLLDGTQSGELQVWYNGKAILFTEILVFPRAKALNFFIAAGDKDTLISFIPQVLDYGYSQGCDRAYIAGGRRGWVKELSKLGWGESGVVMATYFHSKETIQ